MQNHLLDAESEAQRPAGADRERVSRLAPGVYWPRGVFLAPAPRLGCRRRMGAVLEADYRGRSSKEPGVRRLRRRLSSGTAARTRTAPHSVRRKWNQPGAALPGAL